MTSAPRSARWVVMAAGPSIELSMMRTPARGGLAEAGIDVVIPTSGSVLFTPNEPVVEAVREVRAAGGRTAVVTNNVRELSQTWRAGLPLGELFDTILDSCQV